MWPRQCIGKKGYVGSGSIRIQGWWRILGFVVAVGVLRDGCNREAMLFQGLPIAWRFGGLRHGGFSFVSKPRTLLGNDRGL